MNIFLQALIWICRLGVGGLFIFSGLIKANDALGFSYKLEEYFETFGGIFAEHGLGFLVYPMDFFAYMALPMSMVIVVLEIVLGVLTLLGAKMKVVTSLLLALILFFTFLTFVSWKFDLVKTCGCFGDFWVLTPWESFMKDVILLIGIVVLVLARNTFDTILTPVGERLAIWSSSIVFFLFTFYCYRHLPVADHRAYAIGNSLLEMMEEKPGNPLTLYKLVNKKNGALVQIADYPDDYQNWEKFVDPNDPEAPFYFNVDGELDVKFIEIKSTGQKTRVIEIPNEFKDDWVVLKDTTMVFEPVQDPKIQDLSAYSFEDDEDKIQIMLNDSNYRFVLVVRDLGFYGDFLQSTDGWKFAKSSKGEKNWSKIQELRKMSRRDDVYFSVLTSEYDGDKIQAFQHEMDTRLKFYNCDDKELKTMIRSSPGLFLWKKDTVIGKWHYNDFPKFEDVKEDYINN